MRRREASSARFGRPHQYRLKDGVELFVRPAISRIEKTSPFAMSKISLRLVDVVPDQSMARARSSTSTNLETTEPLSPG